MVPEIMSRNEGSELSGATMIPQTTVAGDLTRREDELSLEPGYAVGDCHALSQAVVIKGCHTHAPPEQ